MSASVRIEGLEELRGALRNLPETLKAEAAAIVDAHAREAQRAVATAYPQGPTGNLKRRVSVTSNAGRRFIAESIVKSAAPHAALFEFGTKQRTTKNGANRGRMPAAPPNEAAIPIFIRLRKRMQAALIELVTRNGFEVAA